MPDECPNQQECCPPDSLGYKSCEVPNLYSAADTETFSCEGQPDITITGRGVSSVSQADANDKAAADLTLQLAIYRITNPCEETCTESTLTEIVDCGAQNWPAGPESGLPYTNAGDNVTGWTNIVQGDFTSDGSNIICAASDTNCDRINGILANTFTMTGKVTIPDEDDGEGGCNPSYVVWMLTDTDNKITASIGWSPCMGYQVLVFCDLEADFFSNTIVNTGGTTLLDDVEYDFTFTYIGGVLRLQVDAESIEVDLGCAFFGYVALAAHNPTNSGNPITLNTISIT